MLASQRCLSGLTRSWRKRAKALADWDKVLPVGDFLRDCRDKARCLRFGDGVSIYDSSVVFSDVVVGDNTCLGTFTILDGTGGLEIDSICSISA